MGWKAGTVAADIGAGGREVHVCGGWNGWGIGKSVCYGDRCEESWRSCGRGGETQAGNVIVEESKEAETNLPAGCCEAIFLGACTIT